MSSTYQAAVCTALTGPDAVTVRTVERAFRDWPNVPVCLPVQTPPSSTTWRRRTPVPMFRCRQVLSGSSERIVPTFIPALSAYIHLHPWCPHSTSSGVLNFTARHKSIGPCRKNEVVLLERRYGAALHGDSLALLNIISIMRNANVGAN